MNSREVCELHRKNRYDLILLDLQMPSMDGFQVMENLKTIETDGYLPVLVITAQPDHKLRALKAGARDFVSKPFDLAEVLIRVYNMLEVRLLHLETKRLYDRVLAEQKVSERLLLDVLPRSIAERLKGRDAHLVPEQQEWQRRFRCGTPELAMDRLQVPFLRAQRDSVSCSVER